MEYAKLTSMTWDGNTDGKFYLDGLACKISDEIINVRDITKATIFIYNQEITVTQEQCEIEIDPWFPNSEVLKYTYKTQSESSSSNTPHAVALVLLEDFEDFGLTKGTYLGVTVKGRFYTTGIYGAEPEPEEPTAPIGFIEYLTNPKYHTIKLFYDIIGWKLAQKGGGGSADGEPALVSSDGYTLQDVNGLNLIPKESE